MPIHRTYYWEQNTCWEESLFQYCMCTCLKHRNCLASLQKNKIICNWLLKDIIPAALQLQYWIHPLLAIKMRQTVSFHGLQVSARCSVEQALRRGKKHGRYKERLSNPVLAHLCNEGMGRSCCAEISCPAALQLLWSITVSWQELTGGNERRKIAAVLSEMSSSGRLESDSCTWSL